MTGIHVSLKVNRRSEGERRKFHGGENPHFRLTCTSCGHEATMQGRKAAIHWVTEHKLTHLNPVFVRQQVVAV